jgi:hypothetical protein
VVSRFLAAAGSYVWVAGAGPMPAARVSADDPVLALDHHGVVTVAEVVGIDNIGQADGGSVLTRAGDILLPLQARLATSAGVRRVSELSNGTQRVEILRPGGWVASELPRPPLDLEQRVFALPDTAESRTQIEAALGQLESGVTVRELDPWICVELAPQVSSAQSWGWADEASALEALTSWPPDGDSRTILGNRELRCRLIWSMVTSGMAYEVRWAPAYLPVEARLRRVDRAPAFAPISRLLTQDIALVELRLDARAIVVDLAYLWPVGV